VFAVLLAGYLWLAVAVPGVMTPGRWGRRVGGVTALVFAGLLTFDSYGGSGFDDIGFALPATVLLFPAGAALAAILDHSVGAGVRTALWAGILGALSFVVIVTLSTVDVVRTGTDPTYLEEFARVKSADLAAFETYTVSGALGAGTVMLALLPVWALLLGLVGGAIGEAIRPSDTLAGRPVGHPAH